MPVDLTAAGSLVLSSFLAATLLPFSSEVALTGALVLGMNPVLCLTAASVGNCLGVTLNYFIGLKGILPLLNRLNFSPEKEARFHGYLKKYRTLLWLCTWMPVIGDPLTVYAGTVRLRFWIFAAYAYSLRIIRYMVIYAVYTAYNT